MNTFPRRPSHLIAMLVIALLSLSFSLSGFTKSQPELKLQCGDFAIVDVAYPDHFPEECAGNCEYARDGYKLVVVSLEDTTGRKLDAFRDGLFEEALPLLVADPPLAYIQDSSGKMSKLALVHTYDSGRVSVVFSPEQTASGLILYWPGNHPIDLERMKVLVNEPTASASTGSASLSIPAEAEAPTAQAAVATAPAEPEFAVQAQESVPTEPAGDPPAAAQPAEWKTNWLHFGYDDQLSSYNPNETILSPENVASLALQESFGCNDATFSVVSRTPPIYHGNLYLTSAGIHLYAGIPYTDELLWEFGEGNTGWANQPVASEDGVIYYLEGSIPTSLYALGAQAGKLLWEAQTDFNLGFSDSHILAVDEDLGLLFLVTDPYQSGKLYAIDRTTGDVAWIAGGELVSEEPTFKGDHVLIKDGSLYLPAGTMDEYFKTEKLVQVDPLSGEIHDVYDRPISIEQGTGIQRYGMCGEQLYAGYGMGQGSPVTTLAAYKTGSPEVLWEKSGIDVTAETSCNPDRGILYVPTDGALLALDAVTGQDIWAYQSLGPVYTPTIANGVIYFLSDTNMYALDEATGEKLFRYSLGYDAYPNSQVAVVDGRLYFSGNGGTCDLFILALP